MAGASMNGIKSRIKSVTGTMQITKAMELVATSKLRRAKERVEASRPFYETLGESISDILSSSEVKGSEWTEKRDGGKLLCIVVAGDRGLAGGYNANVFREVRTLTEGRDTVYLPIGKKALEYYTHRGCEIFSRGFEYVQETSVGDAISIGKAVTDAFVSGEISEVVLVYTKFVSMLTQTPTTERLLPLTISAKEKSRDLLYDGELEEILSDIVPQYVGGIVYCSLCEALASESGARRTAMNSANKNAEEMINSLMLKYNRARQAVITQEITEIVSGADAMS
jgi:F-type H+-transporting ATPase subunit gamma